MTTTLRVLDIVEGTIVDGPGLRTAIYLAGCDHRCPGCHNPQSWDFGGGREMTVEQIVERVVYNDFNVTLTGGDPMYHPEAVIELCRAIHAVGKTIWCYTGYTIEEIRQDPRLAPVLDHIDVLVDGPYVQTLRDTSLRFRGSSNQRIIHLREE